MQEVLNVPKSAGLFLINLDHVLVFHPQLHTDRHTAETGKTCLATE